MTKPFLFKAAIAASMLSVLALPVFGQKLNPTTTETGGVAAATGAPTVITSSFLRMHHPEVLVNLAQQVKSGGANKADLTRLAGASFANILLGSDLGPAPGPRKLTGKHDKLPPHILNLPTTLGTNDYSPQKIEYDSMIPTEIETQSVDVTTPFAGTVTASVTNLPNDFKILVMQSYTGYTQGGSGGSSQIVDLTSTNGTLALLDGQQFSLVMQVGSFTEGTFTSTLKLNCTGAAGSWTVSIPMTIKVSSSNKYRAVRQGGSVRLVAFPGKALNFSISVAPVNYRGPFSAKIHSLSLYGITAKDTSVQFNSNKPVSALIQCQCDPNAEIRDITILATEITADDGEATDSTTTIDIVPYQLMIGFGQMSSGYNVSGYQPFGSIGSFIETWRSPGCVIDANGNYTILGNVLDNNGGVWSMTAAGNPWAQFGIYFSDSTGLKHGTYGQVSGQINWLRDNWANIANGVFKAGAWFDPGGCAKWFDGNLPPLKNGKFTLPGAWSSVTVQAWAVPKNT